MSVAVIPNVGRILVEPDLPPDMIGSLHRPSTSYERSQSGTVRTLPEGLEAGYGVGDRVLFSPMAGYEFKVDGETLFLLQPDEVMGWVKANAKPS